MGIVEARGIGAEEQWVGIGPCRTAFCRSGEPPGPLGSYAPPMPAFSGLSKAWVEAEAARPLGSELLGVAKGPREVDPRIASAEWCAWRGSGRAVTALARGLREFAAE